MRHLSALAICLLVAACATTQPPIATGCPALRTWTIAGQAALATALTPIPESSPVWDMERDWQRMRDEIKACNTTTTTP